MTDHLAYNHELLRRYPLDRLIINIVRQEFKRLMAGNTHVITDDQIAQLTSATNSALQTVSDAATAVNTEIAGIPVLVQAGADAAVKKALADAGVSTTPPPVDISAALAALANIQGGVHNIAVAAQLGGASAPATPAPPVTDPTSGDPVAVTAPVVVLPTDPTDDSGTPTAPPAAAGTDGSGQAVPSDQAASPETLTQSA